MLCPADGKGCCDDLCYGSGCMRMDGYPMMEVCRVCSGTLDSGDIDLSTCVCGNDDEGNPNDN